ncbi:MAG: hypothetical protein E7517_01830 [Ruminococcaceae bacterium]|nr:hypothetical protein [Oscillospiraceae bacterium]
MRIDEVSLALREVVSFKGTPYILTGVMMRKNKNNEIHYEAELQDVKANRCLVIVALSSVERKI